MAHRISALLVLLIAPVVLEPSFGAHGYSLVLMVVVAVGAVAAALGLWRDGGSGSHTAAATLAGVVLVGQVAVATFGGPTDASPHWSVHAVVLVAVAAAALVAVTAGLRARRRISVAEDEHPYAL